jgi:hypothetical protein
MTGGADVTDLDMWARGVPYREFTRLRREAPVTWHDEAPPNSGFWPVCGCQDIVTASRDVATFSPARGMSFEEPADEDMAARRTIIDTGPPRRPVRAAATPHYFALLAWGSTFSGPGVTRARG